MAAQLTSVVTKIYGNLYFSQYESPLLAPTAMPTRIPTTCVPSSQPSAQPTSLPFTQPSSHPSISAPTPTPTTSPSAAPTPAPLIPHYTPVLLRRTSVPLLHIVCVTAFPSPRSWGEAPHIGNSSAVAAQLSGGVAEDPVTLCLHSADGGW